MTTQRSWLAAACFALFAMVTHILYLQARLSPHRTVEPVQPWGEAGV